MKQCLLLVGKIKRKVSPPIEQLSDEKDYHSKAPKKEISPVILALAEWVKGKAVSNENLHKMQQFGFIFPDQNGNLQLTPGGKQSLQDNNLA